MAFAATIYQQITVLLERFSNILWRLDFGAIRTKTFFFPGREGSEVWACAAIVQIIVKITSNTTFFI
jgi:hypothetical protein